MVEVHSVHETTTAFFFYICLIPCISGSPDSGKKTQSLGVDVSEEGEKGRQKIGWSKTRILLITLRP